MPNSGEYSEDGEDGYSFTSMEGVNSETYFSSSANLFSSASLKFFRPANLGLLAGEAGLVEDSSFIYLKKLVIFASGRRSS